MDERDRCLYEQARIFRRNKLLIRRISELETQLAGKAR